MSTLGIFHGTANGRQTQGDRFLNHLTVANSATLNCTTLTASDNINCSALRVVGGDVELCSIRCLGVLNILSKDNMNLISDLGDLTVNANKNLVLLSDAGALLMSADQDVSLSSDNSVIQLSSFGNTSINSINANVEITASAGVLLAEGSTGIILTSPSGDIDLDLESGTGNINIQVSAGGTTFINGNNSGRLGFFNGAGVATQSAGAAIGVLTGGNPYLTLADGQDIADTLNTVRASLIAYGLLV